MPATGGTDCIVLNIAKATALGIACRPVSESYGLE